MLNKRLRLLRENRNLTQKDASEIFDISRERYNQYETGKRKPDYDTLMSFAKYFNVTTDYLLGYSNQNIPDLSNYVLNTLLTPNEEELLEIFRRVSNERDQIKLIGRFIEIVEQTTNEAKSNDAQSTPSKKDVG